MLLDRRLHGIVGLVVVGGLAWTSREVVPSVQRGAASLRVEVLAFEGYDHPDSTRDPGVLEVTALLEPLLRQDSSPDQVEEIRRLLWRTYGGDGGDDLGPGPRVVYKHFWRPDLMRWIKVCCPIVPPTVVRTEHGRVEVRLRVDVPID